MPVTPEQIRKAVAATTGGALRVVNVPQIADATNATGIRFYQALALFEQESRGRNVYGKDVGGTLSGFKEPVTRGNWLAFRHEVLVRGRPSNGVGPGQLTYPGFYRQMETAGLDPSNLVDNMAFSCQLWWGYYTAEHKAGWSVATSIKRAGARYNTGSADDWATLGYAQRFYALTQTWRGIVGTDDVA